jgi:hypothetical protein
MRPDKNRFLKGVALFLPLFSVPFAIRYFWAFCQAPVPFIIPDELLYPYTSRLFVSGLASGNFSVFKVNAAHPPLSKFITWLFISLLGTSGFSDMGAMRVQSCLFSSLTCVLIYAIVASKTKKSIGVLSWALLSLDPASIIFALASLDVTSLFFAVLSMHILLRASSESWRPYLLAGVCLGLAALCKYSAYPIILGTLILILLAEKNHPGLSAKGILVLTTSSILVLIAGNPLLWPPQLLGFSGYSALVEDSSRALLNSGGAFSVLTPLDWLQPAFKMISPAHTIFYLSMFAHATTVFPLPIFRYSYLPWLFLGSLLLLLRQQERIDGLKLRSLSWISASCLFFWILAKSQADVYYSVWLQPPLAIFSTIAIADLWRRRR